MQVCPGCTIKVCMCTLWCLHNDSISLMPHFENVSLSLVTHDHIQLPTRYLLSPKYVKLLVFRFKCIIFAFRSILVLYFYNTVVGIITHSLSLVRNMENYPKLVFSFKTHMQWTPKSFTLVLNSYLPLNFHSLILGSYSLQFNYYHSLLPTCDPTRCNISPLLLLVWSF